MDGCIDLWRLDGYMEGRIDIWTLDGYMDGRIDLWRLDGYMDGRIDLWRLDGGYMGDRRAVRLIHGRLNGQCSLMQSALLLMITRDVEIPLMRFIGRHSMTCNHLIVRDSKV